MTRVFKIAAQRYTIKVFLMAQSSNVAVVFPNFIPKFPKWVIFNLKLEVFRVYLKLKTLCDSLCVSCCGCFSDSRVLDLRIVNHFPDFQNQVMDRGKEFNFFQSIHVRIDIMIDISIFIRDMTTKFGKGIHLYDLTERDSWRTCCSYRLSLQDHLKN